MKFLKTIFKGLMAVGAAAGAVCLAKEGISDLRSGKAVAEEAVSEDSEFYSESEEE